MVHPPAYLATSSDAAIKIGNDDLVLSPGAATNGLDLMACHIYDTAIDDSDAVTSAAEPAIPQAQDDDEDEGGAEERLFGYTTKSVTAFSEKVREPLGRAKSWDHPSRRPNLSIILAPAACVVYARLHEPPQRRAACPGLHEDSGL